MCGSTPRTPVRNNAVFEINLPPSGPLTQKATSTPSKQHHKDEKRTCVKYISCFRLLEKQGAVLMDQGPLQSNYRRNSPSDKQVSKKIQTSEVRFHILSAVWLCCKPSWKWKKGGGVVQTAALTGSHYTLISETFFGFGLFYSRCWFAEQIICCQRLKLCSVS